jgi:hypothetical protein
MMTWRKRENDGTGVRAAEDSGLCTGDVAEAGGRTGESGC